MRGYAYVLKNPEVSPRFAWLHQGLTKDAAEPGDTLVCVDTASPSLVPKAFAPWKDAIQLRIDHHGWLHQGLTKDAAEPGDTLVCVDTASPSLVPKAFAPWKDAIQLRIDHHGSATSFTPWEMVDPASASCAEIVWDLLMAMGVQPPAPPVRRLSGIC